VKRQKSDMADAEAMAEVSSRLRSKPTIRGIVGRRRRQRPTMRLVAVRARASRGGDLPHRDLLVRHGRSSSTRFAGTWVSSGWWCRKGLLEAKDLIATVTDQPRSRPRFRVGYHNPDRDRRTHAVRAFVKRNAGLLNNR
jgi:hypothetical protein